jgi:hypothetical protein
MGTQLAPLLRQLCPGVSVQLVTPAFTTDARSVGQVVAGVAEDMHAAMIILPSRGKGAVLAQLAQLLQRVARQRWPADSLGTL